MTVFMTKLCLDCAWIVLELWGKRLISDLFLTYSPYMQLVVY